MVNIDKYDDVIDSRDVVERAGELAMQWAESHNVGGEKLTDEERAELDSLSALLEQIRQSAEDSPEDGVTLIRDSYFRSYAMELADELGLIPEEYTWPASCIDWEQAARELRMDYTSVEFDGVTYWVR